MKPPATTLMYHDIVRVRSANPYELDRGAFEEHLAAIRNVLGERHPALVTDGDLGSDHLPLFITFDDGGESAFLTSAPLLETRGWRGHFFIITRSIGQPGFMTAEQIRDLASRGHEIGSHSASHSQIGHLPPERIAEEWRESTERLAEILERPVRTASVPHGDFNRRVATLAARAGIEVLFTSTPAIRPFVIDGCTVYGRFTVQRGTATKQVVAYASGSMPALIRQRVFWELKSFAKAASRPLYDRTRRLWLARLSAR
jgi:peptidoglycan/xylan/chitin deacetylase (PgdA/CDA1 family)